MSDMKYGKTTSRGTGIGIIVGVVIGFLTDNYGLWIALGLVFGTSIGATIERRRNDE